MNDQDQKIKKNVLKEEIQAEIAEAFEVDLLEVDQYFKEQDQDIDFDWEDITGDSY